MEKEKWEKAYKAVNMIIECSETRPKTQIELTEYINKELGTHLVEKDISNVTKQLGYCHTIKRNKDMAMVFLDNTFKKHI